jgi:hypothetical protein
MAGFTVGGDVAVSDSADTVVFCLKSSSGREVNTYRVPKDKADEFERAMGAEEPMLRSGAGETDPLRLIRISRCF